MHSTSYAHHPSRKLGTASVMESSSAIESTILISNLHCGSCVHAIEEALFALNPLSVDVSIVSQSVTVRHGPKLALSAIESSLEEAGFDIAEAPAGPSNSSTRAADNISDLLLGRRSRHLAQCVSCQAAIAHGPVQSDKSSLDSNMFPNPQAAAIEQGPYNLLLSVGGMTCAACSVTVTRLVSEIHGVLDVAVDLIGHSAKVVIENRKVSEIVVETIEDAGYDAQVVRLDRTLGDSSPPSTGVRRVSLLVEGMFCQHCPTKVMNTLKNFHESVSIAKPLESHTDPILELEYIPAPPNFTIRAIIAAISSAQTPPFKVSIYQPPTLEERVRKMQTAEMKSLLLRLVFSVIVAIPTFIIGIVYMTLVHDTDSTRMYLMEPMWNGMASRTEWALFFLATPVMFYSAGLFHRRSIKEIRALWGRTSRTPVWKRLVRFGSMNLLVSGGVSVAYFASIALLGLSASQNYSETHEMDTPTTYFDSVVFLTMFLLAGRCLEAYSKSRTADAVNSLGKLRPSQALIISPAAEMHHLSSTLETLDPEKGDIEAEELRTLPGTVIETVDVSLLEVGDVVRILNGSSPPADGNLVSGATFFDESSLTGESRPIQKAPGDQVFLGTINQGRVVDVRIDVVGGETMLDRIVNIVREGQTRRAPIERVADLITGYFVPVVTLLAIVTWVVWLGLGFSGALSKHSTNPGVGGWTVWSLQYSIAVFVIACPCGIGLAAPTALLVGSGLAAKFSILVRGGGEAFQECAQLDAIVFDKTGTLTEGGNPIVTDSELLDGPWERKKLMSLAHALESSSSHPVAEAIRVYCGSDDLTPISLSEVEETPGRGLKGTVSDSTSNLRGLIIGNAAWMENHEVTVGQNLISRLNQWQGQGKTVVFMAVRECEKFMLAAVFAIADSIRPEAQEVIKRLQARGLATWMLSGDNAITARAVARLVGIPENNVIAGVLPHEKAEKIQWLQEIGGKRPDPRWRRLFGLKRLNERCVVAMIGDGINDAAALNMADVGIAVGSGSDVAISSASFILLSSNLTSLLTLFDLSRAVFNRVKINFLWAGVYNIVAVPVAAGVIYPARLDPVWASLAMALSSVSVVCSSLMLKLYKEPKL